MVLDDEVISLILPSGAERKLLMRRSWQWQVPSRNKALNYTTYVHLSVSHPGCCGDGEADPRMSKHEGQLRACHAG